MGNKDRTEVLRLLLFACLLKAVGSMMAGMERMWCWRRKSEMPMLDEDEFLSVQALYSGGIKATKEFRQKWGIALEGVPINDLFRPVRKRYEELTGMKDCHQNAIMHHRVSLYGPPCEQCGKPLRTPKAKLCGACMHPRSQH